MEAVVPTTKMGTPVAVWLDSLAITAKHVIIFTLYNLPIIVLHLLLTILQRRDVTTIRVKMVELAEIWTVETTNASAHQVSKAPIAKQVSVDRDLNLLTCCCAAK